MSTERDERAGVVSGRADFLLDVHGLAYPPGALMVRCALIGIADDAVAAFVGLC